MLFRSGVLEEEAAKMLEMIPGGVGGDEDRAEQFTGVIINGQQEGLLVLGGPPLVAGGIVLPEFINARALPASAGFGTGFGLADEIGKMSSGEGGH